MAGAAHVEYRPCRWVVSSQGRQGRQATPGTFPVIVVFRDDASFHQHRRFFHPDERAGAVPETWDYLAHGGAGAVQFPETIHAFRAEPVISAAPLTGG